MEFTAEQVWACAAAAERINGGYLKEDQWMHNATPPYLDKTANKTLVKNWLRTSDFVELTEADYAAGREARQHFNSYTLLALKGAMNEFQVNAMKVAAMETFTGRNLYEFAIISCLPSVAARDRARNELSREIWFSDQLSYDVGDTVISDITVLSAAYVQDYGKFHIKARLNDSYVSFYFAAEMKKGETVRIKAKVKAHRSDKTTQLNYVKKI